MKSSAFVTALVLGSFSSSVAFADASRCVAAFESTQRLRKSGSLGAARSEALVCSATSCPSIVVRDCAAWLTELEAATPTVVFAASSAGRELVDVEVLVDGASLATRLDGRARPLDPGAHRVRFVAAGYTPVEMDVVVAEGEKNRKLTATLAREAQPVGTEIPHARAEAPHRPVPTLTWVLGGASTLAFTGGAVFGIDGLGKKSDLDALGCRPGCDGDAVSAAERSFLVADALTVVGLVAATAAIVFYVLRPEVSATTAAARAHHEVRF